MSFTLDKEIYVANNGGNGDRGFGGVDTRCFLRRKTFSLVYFN